jgi:hypothetical protein
MVSGADLLIDGFGRVRETVHEVVTGLSDADLRYRADPEANSICWEIWHLTRVQDDHVADAGGLLQVWLSGGWFEQADLPLDRHDTGYGHRAEQVALVCPPGSLLVAYHDATYEQTVNFVRGLGDEDMDIIVDRRWDPPVTMAVRLISVLADDLQHAGQAAFIRGLIERRT